VPETVPQGAEGMRGVIDGIVNATMLKRAATLEDVGNVAVFAASAWARTMTATALNITAGSVVD
jgi:3-oxoacyl-[acyl-carrier protein] reductase